MKGAVFAVEQYQAKDQEALNLVSGRPVQILATTVWLVDESICDNCPTLSAVRML